MLLKVDSRDTERDKKITWFNEFCQYAQCIIRVCNKIEVSAKSSMRIFQKLANNGLTHADQYIKQNCVSFLKDTQDEDNVENLKFVQTNRNTIDYVRIECIKIDAEVRARFQGLVMATNKTLYAGL
ncbi:hypothetical protein Ciccas_000503 [Cichlidogyrus casuarinus]|uniref:Uncharacterized protein n=1 Tax=Cichlidogyrus casuarinus TaxID=1844966 RepID=A0ABD2QN08_9PLAT